MEVVSEDVFTYNDQTVKQLAMISEKTTMAGRVIMRHEIKRLSEEPEYVELHMKLFRSTRVQRDISFFLEKFLILESRSFQGPSRGNRVQRDISRS